MIQNWGYLGDLLDLIFWVGLQRELSTRGRLQEVTKLTASIKKRTTRSVYALPKSARRL